MPAKSNASDLHDDAVVSKDLTFVANEFICPITRELPIDPVTAEDGRIYERAAMETLIKTSGKSLRSPVTNENMGPNLLPAVQVRNTIAKLVASTGGIDSEKAERWMERIKEKEQVEIMRRRARDGDSDAMYILGIWYEGGMNGLPIDLYKAYDWYKQAADLGDVYATARVGMCFLEGRAVKKNPIHGMHLLTVAAENGSDAAAYFLAQLFYQGVHGLPKDLGRAQIYFQKVVNGECKFKHLSREKRKKAKLLLKKLEDTATLSKKLEERDPSPK